MLTVWALTLPLFPLLIWILFVKNPDGAPTQRWFILILLPVLLWIGGTTMAAGWRTARGPAGRVAISPDQIVITDPAVFSQPITIACHEVADVTAPPPGRLSMGVFGAGSKERAAIVSPAPDRPNVLIRFTAERGFDEARRRHGLSANAPIRAPERGKAVAGLWLRADNPAEATRFISQWSNP